MEYEYIDFIQLPSTGKTLIWNCINKKSNFVLGTVKWYSNWRQYCFMPNPNEGTVFSMGCLDDISDFIDKQMEERKK